MLQLLKYLPKSLIKSGIQDYDNPEAKSHKYLYLTLLCMLIYSLNKYKHKKGGCCSSCGSSSSSCSCSKCSSCGSSSSSCSCSKCESCGSSSSSCSCSKCESCGSNSSSCSCSCTTSTSCDNTSTCETSSSSCKPTSSSCEVSSSSKSECGNCGSCKECRKECGDPYPLCVEDYCEKYKCHNNCGCYSTILVNENHLCIPQLMFRTVPGCINFFYNFYIGNMSIENINSLIMLKDLLTWKTNGGISIGSDILPDCIYPVYFVYKEKDGKICCYEYLKIFINTDDCGTRTAFVSKGKDYLCIVDKINFLLVGCDDCPFILDLLNGSEYYTYNISESCPQTLLSFIYALVSLYLIPNCLLGKQIIYDISHCNEVQKQLEFFFDYFNCDCQPYTCM